MPVRAWRRARVCCVGGAFDDSRVDSCAHVVRADGYVQVDFDNSRCANRRAAAARAAAPAPAPRWESRATPRDLSHRRRATRQRPQRDQRHAGLWVFPRHVLAKRDRSVGRVASRPCRVVSRRAAGVLAARSCVLSTNAAWDASGEQCADELRAVRLGHHDLKRHGDSDCIAAPVRARVRRVSRARVTSTPAPAIWPGSAPP